MYFNVSILKEGIRVFTDSLFIYELLLNLFNFYDSNNIHDLFYNPFVVINDNVILSPYLCSCSFFERNAILIAKKKANTEEKFKVINNRKEFIEIGIQNLCNKLPLVF